MDLKVSLKSEAVHHHWFHSLKKQAEDKKTKCLTNETRRQTDNTQCYG